LVYFVVQAATSGWFLVKISFAASLLLVLTVGGAGGTERSWLLFILGCACGQQLGRRLLRLLRLLLLLLLLLTLRLLPPPGLLVLCRLLVRDLTVLSLPEPRPGGAHYKLLPTGPGRAEHV
jgi:hypothetical protein